jgi:hypothetical protein
MVSPWQESWYVRFSFVRRLVFILSQVDYQQVLSIFAKFNDDQDTVVLQFPLKKNQ